MTICILEREFSPHRLRFCAVAAANLQLNLHFLHLPAVDSYDLFSLLILLYNVCDESSKNAEGVGDCVWVLKMDFK